MGKPKEIHAQQLAENAWGLVVDGETLEERFSSAKEACDYGKEEYGIEPKARMMKKNSKGSTKKKSKKSSSKEKKLTKSPNPSDDEEPEELPEKNHLAKVHVDSDLRWPKSIRKQLPLVRARASQFNNSSSLLHALKARLN